MGLILKDRVLETCTSPGTGTVTLLGATVGYQTFSTAVGNGNTTYYTIADQSGANWEVGIGTYTSTGNTLTRTTVLSSSNGGTLTNFNSGTQNVFVTYPSEEAIYNNGTSIVGPTGSSLAPANGGTGATTLTGYVYGNGTSAMTASTTIPTSSLSGTLAVGNGGKGATTLTANGVVYGNGTSAVGVTAVGTTGQVLVGNTGAAPSWATLSSSAVTSITGTTNQITASASTGAVTLSIPASATTGQWIANQTTSGSSTQGAFAYGTLGYSDVNHILTMAASQNNYIQMEIQNTNSGNTASSDVVVGNNNTTASTYYGDFGMNSSGWTGTGAFTAPNNVYLTATSGDLAIGTTTSNQIRFAVNGGTTDALTISTAGNVTTPNVLTGAEVVASNGLILNSATVSTSYSIASGNNAMSVGPMTVASGQSVTVPSGSRWVVL
jgi:hypothetical protein